MLMADQAALLCYSHAPPPPLLTSRNRSAFASFEPITTDAVVYDLPKPLLMGHASARWERIYLDGRGSPGLALDYPSAPGAATAFVADYPAHGRHVDPLEASHRLGMAELHGAAVQRGYAGVLGWSFNCDPMTDETCIDRGELARGLQRGAAAAGRPFGWQLAAAMPARLGARGYDCSCGGNKSEYFPRWTEDLSEWQQRLKLPNEHWGSVDASTWRYAPTAAYANDRAVGAKGEAQIEGRYHYQLERGSCFEAALMGRCSHAAIAEVCSSWCRNCEQLGGLGRTIVGTLLCAELCLLVC